MLKLPSFKKDKKIISKVIGVAGSYGKSSVVELLYRLILESNMKAVFFSSFGYSLDGVTINHEKGINKISKREFNKLLDQVIENQPDFLLIEQSYSQIIKNYFKGIQLDLGIITNTVDDDLEIKQFWKKGSAILDFINNLKHEGTLIVNENAGTNTSWIKEKGDKIEHHIYSYWYHNESLNNIELDLTATQFSIEDNIHFKSSLLGLANLENLNLAIRALGKFIDLKTLPDLVKKIEKLEYNMYKPMDSYNIFIDNANSPYSLESALEFLDRYTKGRLILVFGIKDEFSHKVQSFLQYPLEYCEVIIAAANDPRNQKVSKINERVYSYSEIDNGLLLEKINSTEELDKLNFELFKQKMHKAFVENLVPLVLFNQNSFQGRLDAIRFALTISKPDDVVLIAGKGKDDVIQVGNVDYEWSDEEAVRLSLNNLS